MISTARTSGLVLLLGVTLSGCATVWTVTQPAISRASYELQLLSVRPPLDPTWRLSSYREGSQVIFLHADTGDRLAVWWVPVTPEEVKQSPEETVLAYFKELLLEELQYSGDYELNVVTSKEWTPSAQDGHGQLMYLKGTQRGSQNFEAWVIYREKQFNQLPIVEVFTYAHALTSSAHAVEAGAEAPPIDILTRLVEQASPGHADPQQVMWQRASTTYDRFRALSEKRGQAKEKPRLTAAHQAAKREVQNALAVIPGWPEVHDTAGLLASYNDNHEFLGKGFDTRSAEGAYQEALRLRKNFKLARIHLARMYQALERWPDALDQYQELSEISPNDAEYYYEQGKLLEKLGRPTDALRVYQQARRYWIGAVETRKELEGKIKALEHAKP